jgi:hypothetical protein
MRLALAVAFTLATPSPALSQKASPGCSSNQLLSRPDVRNGVEELYRETNLDGREHVMVVLPDSVAIRPTNPHDGIHIRFAVPPDAIAIFHTHPFTHLERPSQQDIDGIKALQRAVPGMCSYVAGTIDGSSRTLYKISPDGSVVLVGFP